MQSENMLIKFKLGFVACLVIAGALLAPGARAAVVSVKSESAPVSVGDTVFLDVRIDTEGQNINVLEGSINFVSGLEGISIRELSVAGSAFTMWPNKPSLSLGSKGVTFSGGVPGGINAKTALVFKIALQAEKPGQIVVTPSNIKAYLNDGRATPVQIKVGPLNFPVVPQSAAAPRDDLSKVIIGDEIKPEEFVASIGSDPSLFDGKTFVAVSAIDNESGIDHYEVIEGSRPAVRSGSVYVFQNQKFLEPTVIIAYDKAGNTRKVFLRERSIWERISPVRAVIAGLVLILLLALMALGVRQVLKHFKRSNARNKSDAKED